jgi:hypothetical protein
VAAALGVWSVYLANTLTHDSLFVEAQHLHLGEVWEDDNYGWTLPISNSTDKPIRILSFSSSCNCASISPASLMVSPGETSKVSLTLNLKAGRQDADAATHDFAVSLRPETDPPNATPGWTIVGKVKKVLHVSPPQIDFEESLIRGLPFESRSVSITCHAPVADIYAWFADPMLKTEVSRIGDSEYVLTVAPEATLNRSVTCETHLTAVSPAGLNYPPVKLPIHARVVEDVRLVPISLSVGAHQLGETVSDIVSLTSRTGRPFSVIESSANSKDVDIEPLLRDGPNDDAKFRVSVRITERKEKCVTAKFSVCVHDGKTIELPLAVSYFGLTP